MKNREKDRPFMALLAIISASILGVVSLRLLHINLPQMVYQIMIAAYLLIALFCIYILVKKGRLIHPVPQELRIDVLRKYAEYDLSHKEKSYSYTFQMGNEPPAILEKYNYTEYLKGVEPVSDALAFRLLDFVCDHFHHGGNARIGYAHRMADIVKNESKLGQIELMPKGYLIKDFPDKSRFVYHPAAFWSI